MNYLNDPHYDVDEAQLDHFDQGAAKRQRYQLWKERLNQVELQIEKDEAAPDPDADLSPKKKWLKRQIKEEALLRLEEAAKIAQEGEFDYFTTTLSISPMKNAEKLNEIGNKVGGKYGVSYLQSDFKKKNGYKRSTELSTEYGMYRQYYCGCVFSEADRYQKQINRDKEKFST